MPGNAAGTASATAGPALSPHPGGWGCHSGPTLDGPLGDRQEYNKCEGDMIKATPFRGPSPRCPRGSRIYKVHGVHMLAAMPGSQRRIQLVTWGHMPPRMKRRDGPGAAGKRRSGSPRASQVCLGARGPAPDGCTAPTNLRNARRLLLRRTWPHGAPKEGPTGLPVGVAAS